MMVLDGLEEGKYSYVTTPTKPSWTWDKHPLFPDSADDVNPSSLWTGFNRYCSNHDFFSLKLVIAGYYYEVEAAGRWL